MSEGLVNNPSVICYGTLRSNDLDAKFSRKPAVHDLLFVFNTLKSVLGDEEAVKIVIRYATLLFVGPDEVTALKKLCCWNSRSFQNLLSVIQLFEKYETTDSRCRGNQGRLMRGEPLPLQKVLFKRLAKVEAPFFDENVQNVFDRKDSLKDLVSNFERFKEYQRILDIILKVSGNDNPEELNNNFPGAFVIEKVEEFKGALIEGSKKNMAGVALVNYCKSVISGGKSGNKEIVSSVNFITSPSDQNQNNMGDFNVLVLNIKSSLDEIVEVIDGLLSSRVESKLISIVGLFVKECDQSSVLIHTRNLKQSKNFLVTQILFDSLKNTSDGQVEENIKFGILVSRSPVLAPPLMMYNQGLANLGKVVSQICPSGSSVAFINESDLPIVKIHGEDESRKVTYFAEDKVLKDFKKELTTEEKQANTLKEGSLSISVKPVVAITSSQKEGSTNTDEDDFDGDTAEENDEDVYKFSDEMVIEKKGGIMSSKEDDMEAEFVEKKVCISRQSSTSSVGY